MPYFERLPYAEMIARAADSLPAARWQSSGQQSTGKSPILERAAMILKEESAGLPSLSANPLKVPFADIVSGQTPDAGKVLLLNPPAPVKAGQTASVVLSIVNDSEASISFSMMTTHLISPSGARIAANNIDISPEEAVLAPAQAVDVQIEVDVPDILIPGEYSGLFQACGQQTARAVLVINVTN